MVRESCLICSLRMRGRGTVEDLRICMAGSVVGVAHFEPFGEGGAAGAAYRVFARGTVIDGDPLS
jgi:hypothetical protein